MRELHIEGTIEGDPEWIDLGYSIDYDWYNRRGMLNELVQDIVWLLDGHVIRNRDGSGCITRASNPSPRGGIVTRIFQRGEDHDE